MFGRRPPGRPNNGFPLHGLQDRFLEAYDRLLDNAGLVEAMSSRTPEETYLYFTTDDIMVDHTGLIREAASRMAEERIRRSIQLEETQDRSELIQQLGIPESFIVHDNSNGEVTVRTPHLAPGEVTEE